MSTDYFIDKNEQTGCRKTKLSPSGRYLITLRYYSTKEGAWSYSRGTVIDAKTDRQIADIKRCYSDFFYEFVTKGETEYLIAGRSYMGQTIVNLSTGEEYNDPAFYRKLNEDEKQDRQFGNYEGYEFCWSDVTPFEDAKTLYVEGCHWACPFEYRFYDFTDPSKGWPELEIKGSKIGIETIGSDDFENFDYDENAENGPASEYFIVPEIVFRGNMVSFKNKDFTLTLRRDGNVMRVIDEWSSERRTTQLAEQERAYKEHTEKFTKARESNPYYIWLCAQKTEGVKADSSFASHYPSQNDVKNGDPNWVYFGVRFEKENKPKNAPNATVKFGIEAGNIYVDVWIYGKGDVKTEFERSQAGLEAVYVFALTALGN